MRPTNMQTRLSGLRLLLAGTAIAFAMPSVAAAQDLSELRAQLDALANKVEELEAAQATEQRRVRRVEERLSGEGVAPIPIELRNPNAIGAKIREVPADDNFRPQPGTAFVLGNTEIEIGGYAKLDFIFDTEESTGDLFVPFALDIEDVDDEEAFVARARESRLFFIARTPTSLGDLKVHLEGDFFADNISSNEIFTNGFPFRLRHAYGELDMGRHEFLAGQFWSELVPIETYPVTVDFGGPVGNSFLRQAQLRYTYKPDDSLRFAVSLENSETTLRDDALELGGGLGGASTALGLEAGIDTVPDLIMTATHKSDRHLIKGGVLLRLLNAPDSSDSELGYGIQISGKYDITDRLTFSGQAIYGEGIGRYTFAGVNQGAFLTGGLSGGSIDAIESVSGFARMEYDLTDTITTIATYGRIEMLETFTPFDTEHIQSLHLTTFYQPLPDLQLGAEVILAERELVNGMNDDFLRFHTSVRWNF